MAGSVNIFLDEGATGNNVEARDGVADHETAVVTFSPDRGTAARILNAVAAGSSRGLPLFLKPRDSNGDPLPVGSTTIYLAVKRAGSRRSTASARRSRTSATTSATTSRPSRTPTTSTRARSTSSTRGVQRVGHAKQRGHPGHRRVRHHGGLHRRLEFRPVGRTGRHGRHRRPVLPVNHDGDSQQRHAGASGDRPGPPEHRPGVFDWSANSQGQRSRVARLRAETAHKLLGKESDRALELALPAYESLGPTNGTDGDQETFSVTHGIRDCPNTQNVVVWLDGDYYGTPDNDDAVDTGDIQVTDPGSNSTVHVFYIPNKAGTLEIEKAADGSTSTSKNLKTVSVKNLHRKNLSEQPEFFEFRDGSDPLEPFVAADMTLDVYVDVPYVTRYEDPDGDGAVATNALLNFTAMQGRDVVPGLKAEVTASM